MESRRGRGEEILPEYGVVWLEASESATGGGLGGVSSMVLKELARDCGSHSPDHGEQDCGWGGGVRGRGTRGGVNVGPTCSVAKKACHGLDGPDHMFMVPVQGL
jgi:hypothetical protein